MSEVVKSFLRPDGEQRVSIVRLETGALTIDAETRKWEVDFSAPNEGADAPYWSPALNRRSFFDDIETAEREVAARFPWTGLSNT